MRPARFPNPTALLLAAALAGCGSGGDELPSIEGWSGEPQVAVEIEKARAAALEAPDSGAAVGRLGMLFQAHDLLAEAAACYRRAAELAPADARWPYLGALSLRKLDLAASLPLFEAAIERGADHAALFIHYGDTLARLDRPAEARSQYRRALEAAPRSSHALLGLARLEMAAGDLEGAREHLESAVDITARHGELHRLLAQVYRRLGRGEEAERELVLASANPDPSQAVDPVYQEVEAVAVTSLAHLRRGRRLARQGRYREAEVEYRRVLELRPAVAGDYSNLGAALAGQGRVEEAIAEYEKGLALDPEDPYLLNNLAMALVDRGNLEGAVARLRQALEIEPAYPEAHHNLGLVRERQGRSEEAIAHYRDALRHRPGFAAAHSDLGKAHAGRGELEPAIQAWRLALEIDPTQLSALYNLSVALGRRGEHDEAVEWLRRGLEIAPNSSRLASLLAWQLATAPEAGVRDGAEATRLARRVYDAYPSQPTAGDVLAAALAEGGRFDEAVRVAERAEAQARSSGQGALADSIRRRLEGYRGGRPYRQPLG